MAEIIRKETLKKAILNAYSLKGLSMEESVADELAEYLLAFFGYGKYMLDNILEKYDRMVFYMLEDKGILTTEKDEEHISPSNKYWQINYWKLNTEKIEQLANEGQLENKYSNLYDRVYAELGKRENPNEVDTKPFQRIASSSANGETPVNVPKPAEKGRILSNLLYMTLRTLSPDIKPLLYLAMRPGVAYTQGALLSEFYAMLPEFSGASTDSKVNVKSLMESLNSLGLVSEGTTRNIKGCEATTYTKISGDTIYDAFAALAIKWASGMRKEDQDAPALFKIFSYSSGTKGVEHSRNVFNLFRKLETTKDRGYKLCEISRGLNGNGDSRSWRTLKRLAGHGILNYSAYTQSGDGSSASKYYVIAPISRDELIKAGVVSQGRKSPRLDKVLEFVNANAGKEIDRMSLSNACGVDKDHSSMYLIKLSKAGFLRRECAWNSGRTNISGNDITASAWKGFLEGIYRVAEWFSESNAEKYHTEEAYAFAKLRINDMPEDLKPVFSVLEAYRNDKASLIEDMQSVLKGYLSVVKHTERTADPSNVPKQKPATSTNDISIDNEAQIKGMRRKELEQKDTWKSF